MSALMWILTALAGGCGATCRWLLSGAITRRLNAPTSASSITRHVPGSRAQLLRPLCGIAAVNVIGCLLAGAFTFLTTWPHWWTVIGVGFLGAFTTFSTAVVDVCEVLRSHRTALGASLLVGVWALCVVAVIVGAGAALVAMFAPHRRLGRAVCSKRADTLK